MRPGSCGSIVSIHLIKRYASWLLWKYSQYTCNKTLCILAVMEVRVSIHAMKRFYFDSDLVQQSHYRLPFSLNIVNPPFNTTELEPELKVCL